MDRASTSLSNLYAPLPRLATRRASVPPRTPRVGSTPTETPGRTPIAEAYIPCKGRDPGSTPGGRASVRSLTVEHFNSLLKLVRPPLLRLDIWQALALPRAGRGFDPHRDAWGVPLSRKLTHGKSVAFYSGGSWFDSKPALLSWAGCKTSFRNLYAPSSSPWHGSPVAPAGGGRGFDSHLGVWNAPQPRKPTHGSPSPTAGAGLGSTPNAASVASSLPKLVRSTVVSPWLWQRRRPSGWRAWVRFPPRRLGARAPTTRAYTLAQLVRATILLRWLLLVQVQRPCFGNSHAPPLLTL